METAQRKPPLVVGIGGTLRSGSSSEKALRVALGAAAELGAQIAIIAGRDLELPIYNEERVELTRAGSGMLDLIRRSDGLIISSPGYHGSISGLIKNAVDYVEELRTDVRPYWTGRAVGLIACAYGWQATGTTLASLRSVVHALRGWPTPLGVAVNSSLVSFSPDGGCSDDAMAQQLRVLGQQVVEFAMANRAP